MDPRLRPASFFREREVKDIQPGGHHCHVFETTEQSLMVLVPFLADGLEAGDRCFSTLAETPIEDVREALEERGVDTEARIAQGDLILRPADDGYGDPGSFDVQGRIDDLETMVWEAREEGYENLRSAGEMSWAAGEGIDRETLVRYEAELNRFLDSEAGEHFLGVCQYHLSVFQPEVAADVLRAHPLTIHGTRVCRNLFYRPPEVLLADDPSAEVDHILDRLTSEPERARATREALEELEDRNERLNRFREVTSQAVKDDLEALKAHLEGLEEDVDTPWTGRAGPSIEFAVEGAGRIEEVIETMIEYERIETRELDLSPIDSDDALAQARSQLEARLEEAGIEVTHDQLPSLEADRESLVHVFVRLLANAVERGDPDLSRIHVGAEEAGGTWRFSVEDDGRSIPPEERKRVLDVFERGVSTGSAEEVGLGLALCQRIVDRHGGRISLEDASSGGTRFSFTIPKATEPAPGSRRDATGSPAG